MRTNLEKLTFEMKLLKFRPKFKNDKSYKALIFDSVYHVHRGAIIYVACTDGEIKKGDRVTSYFTQKSYEVQEVGIARPNFVPTNKLSVLITNSNYL